MGTEPVLICPLISAPPQKCINRLKKLKEIREIKYTFKLKEKLKKINVSHKQKCQENRILSQAHENNSVKMSHEKS